MCSCASIPLCVRLYYGLVPLTISYTGVRRARKRSETMLLRGAISYTSLIVLVLTPSYKPDTFWLAWLMGGPPPWWIGMGGGRLRVSDPVSDSRSA